MTETVRQLDIQRRGGICATAPTACMVFDLLREANIRPKQVTVLDLTYGEGRFWLAARPRLLIGADVAVHEWLEKPDIFIPRPAWQAWRIVEELGIHVDIIAVDPPWVARGSARRRHFGLDIAIGGPRLILMAAEEAARRLGAQYILVHYKERWLPRGYTVAIEKEWQPWGRTINLAEGDTTTWWAILAASKG